MKKYKEEQLKETEDDIAEMVHQGMVELLEEKRKLETAISKLKVKK